MKKDKIFVTQPDLPPLEEFIPYLEDIWESKWLTNNGRYHEELEAALCEYLGVKHISLFANGTLALLTALQVLDSSGEIITTPFSFVATTHALWWNGIKPVFCDVEPDYFNLDPAKIEAAITPKTSAILPVHVYGNPCNIDDIQKIASTHGLKVIYDAAHAFGVEQNGNSVLNFGDLSILSFHATKVFNTIEGGAIICHDAETKKRIDFMKNFGFADEVTVVAPGINAKMNELQAAYGLLQLKYADGYIAERKKIAQTYANELGEVPGISFLKDISGVKHNYAYFPILVDENRYNKTRDELYSYLQENNIYGRRYFYPLISHFPSYNELSSASPSNLPVAEKVAGQVICLPIFPGLDTNNVIKICKLIQQA